MTTYIRNYFAILIISISAGLLYNSWPFGYWLNPTTSKLSLASGLEAPGQPYNWMFIGGDVVSSVLVIVFAYLLWRVYQDRKSKRVNWVIISLIGYSVFTIADALYPVTCIPNLQNCPSFVHEPTLIIHGFFSITASLFLFASLFILWFHERKNVIMNVLIIGYILFGLFSLIDALAPGKNSNWSQHYYISLCSVWLILIPYVLLTLFPAKINKKSALRQEAD